jgi:prohibitin 2
MSSERVLRNWVKIAVPALLVVVTFFSSCTVVEAGSVAVVKNLGALEAQPLYEGVHFRAPFRFSTVTTVPTTVESVVTKALTSSHDLQAVETTISVQYSIKPGLAPRIIKRFGSVEALADNVLGPAIQESIRSATARYTAEQLIKRRPEVKQVAVDTLRAFVDATLASKQCAGALIIANVAVTEFHFSKEFDLAIESKVKAEQEALQEKTEKEKRITKAEASKREKELEAEGNANKIRLESEAWAFKVEKESTARAGAIDREGKAVRENPQLINLRRVERWNGALPKFQGASTPLISVGEL